MRKSLLGLLGCAFVLTLSSAAFAVGLGGITVGTGLGQPLKADIDLVAVSKAEKASLVARLAPPDVYKEAGLEYPYGNKFSFQVESRADGAPYLKVSSELPITDPFVVMLVELTWSAGKLVREYTFLLDPPGYVPDQPVQAPVQAVAPAVQSAPPDTTVTPFGYVPPKEVAVAPMEQASSAAQDAAAPVEQPDQETAWLQDSRAKFVPASAGEAAQAAEELPELDEFVVIKRGDTLREVAERYRLADVSLDQMLVALYRVNADRFDGKNMNRIKAGKVLRLPHEREVEAVSQSDAVREIRAQTADWNVYRQKLASAAVPRKESREPQQIATGKISSSIADKAPVAKETAREVLKLSRGDAPGDGTTAGAGSKVPSAQDKRNAEQEESIARSKALKEEQDRAAMLAKGLKDIQRLAEIKSQTAALAESSRVAASGVATASGVAAAGTEKPKTKPKPKVVEPEPLMDQMMSGVNRILAEPLYLGGALALLVLGGLGFVLRQKKKPIFEALGEPSEIAETTGGHVASSGRIAAPVVSSPDTGDFTRMGEVSGAALESDHIDPIGEADLFLNFGRDAQAEEILKEALQNTPNDHRIHLKLLGIYANRVDANSFSAIARQLRDSGDADAWQQAVAMGRKLEPNNPMYGGSSAVEETGSATAVFNAPQLNVPGNEPPAPSPVLDFDIDLGSFAAKAAPSPEQEFLGGGEQSAMMSFDVTTPEQAPAMDFDVAAPSGKSEKPGAALPDTGDMMFDVGSFASAIEEQPKAAEPVQSNEGMMEFTLDFPVEKPAEAAAPGVRMAEMGLAGISLNFDDEGARAQTESVSKDDQWQEVATKLDLAKAYQEMGDASGAREILDEVLREGDAEQREAAQALLNQLG